MNTAVSSILKNLTPKRILFEDWIKKGMRLYGNERDAWQFKCPQCGHVQSAQSVREHNPGVDSGKPAIWLRNWVSIHCEGNLSSWHGCSYQELKAQLHSVYIVMDDGRELYVFPFAAADEDEAT